MKTLLPLSLGLLLSACRLSAAPVDSLISAVTVYPDRAVVTRTATVDLAAGTQEIVFENLPSALVDQSLQVSGQGTAQATFLDVSSRQNYVAFTPNERVKAIEDELRGLQQQVRVLDDRTALLKEEGAFIRRLLQSSSGPISIPVQAGPAREASSPNRPAPRPTLEELQKLYGYADEALGRIAAEQQSIDIQREDLQIKKTALEKQLNDLRGAGGRSYKTVMVRVASAGGGNLEIALAYTVPNASWTPAYDARVLSNDHAVALSCFGVVRQKTGEDWKDVALTLSTARPSLGGAPPSLAPWTVDVAHPRPVEQAVREPRLEVAMKSAIGGLTAPSVVMNAAETDDQIHEAQLATAVLNMQATSASLKIPVATTVPCDNSPQKAPITQARLESRSEYSSVPKRLQAAFLTAKVTNSSDFPLLAGAMNVFLDSTFVAASSLRTVMPGEKFDLALGVDEGIGVKHKRVNRFTEDTGITNSGKRITYDFLLTVQNNKKTAARIVFADQIPVSRNEKIVVKLLLPAAGEIGTPEKPKEIVREVDGTIKWTLNLKPGEKRELPLKFSIEYPNDVIPTGLE
ncbi:MAG: mucoidy inhibitor MuiA family protein [Opitutaceae bacterium]|nr:mucoidy inhibitor MuiA family protein [Opitutaceae bacterium]